MFFVTEKQQKAILNFSSDSLNLNKKYKKNKNKKKKKKKKKNLLNEPSDSKFATKKCNICQ